MSRKIPDDDEDVIARLTELLSPQGFALLEALAEQLRKNPPTDDDLARVKRELFANVAQNP